MESPTLMAYQDGLEDAARMLEAAAREEDELALRALRGPISKCEITPAARDHATAARTLRAAALRVRGLKVF